VSSDGNVRTRDWLRGRKTWVAGHRGMVGQALVRQLTAKDCELVICGRDQVDLRRQVETEEWLAENRPEIIFLAAAKVGGILANDSLPASFLYDNLAIELNVIEAARRIGVAKIIVLGSSCIYPRLAAQPIAESALLTGPLEPTNQWYAIAKIAGIKLGQAYRRQYGLDCVSVMPTNLYGPGDNFDLQSSHVLPALLRKIHAAKETQAATVEIWGTGKPRREFMYVEDCAAAVIHVAEHYSGEEHINIGTGQDVSIRELAEMIADAVGYQGEFHYNTNMPDGTPQKQLDVSRLQELGWRSSVSLRDGLRQTYAWYLQHLPPLP
jgi:GDP-L-fucose synthase